MGLESYERRDFGGGLERERQPPRVEDTTTAWPTDGIDTDISRK